MLLVGSDLDVVRTDGGLVLIGVIQTLNVRQVADVKSGNVVGSGEGEVEEATVLGDIRARGWSVPAYCAYRLIRALTRWRWCRGPCRPGHTATRPHLGYRFHPCDEGR